LLGQVFEGAGAPEHGCGEIRGDQRVHRLEHQLQQVQGEGGGLCVQRVRRVGLYEGLLVVTGGLEVVGTHVVLLVELSAWERPC
jgi:hypothetical protein